MTDSLYRAFAAGVAGTAAMMAVSSATGSGVIAELTRLAGTVTSTPGSRASYPVGLGTQLLNGGLFGVFYHTAFARLDRDVDWRTGAVVGVAHGLAAGLFLALVPALHPRVPENLPPPGAFMLNHGSVQAITFLALHGLFSIIVTAASPRRGHS
jgi:hypothetical protein